MSNQEDRIDQFEKLFIQKLDEVAVTRGKKPLEDREAKIISSRISGEIESAHDDIARIWNVISDLGVIMY